jgi:hypothetical protein
MANLTGLSNDTQFQVENEFLITYYKAFRAYFISLFYLANKKYKEAVGFFFRVEKYVKTIESSFKNISNVSELSVKNYKAELELLVKELNQSKYKIQTAALLEVGTGDIENNSTGKENLVNII